MRKLLPFMGLLLLAVAGGMLLHARGTASIAAAPNASVASLNAGCYRATPTVCRLRVDPFTVEIPIGARLESLTLQANGKPIYDFRTDLSNPPSGSYSLSRVKLDFAATCGRAYVISVLVDDTSQSEITTAAETETLTCPEGQPDEPTPTPPPDDPTPTPPPDTSQPGGPTFDLFLPIVLR
jgi:hypothetical protein